MEPETPFASKSVMKEMAKRTSIEDRELLEGDARATQQSLLRAFSSVLELEREGKRMHSNEELVLDGRGGGTLLSRSSSGLPVQDMFQPTAEEVMVDSSARGAARQLT